MWEEITNWLQNFFQQPVVIAGVSVGTLGAIALTLLGKTSFGKKSIKALTKGYETLKAEYKKNVDQLEAYKNNLSSRYEDYKELVSEQVSLIGTELNDCKELIKVVVENSHNEKVKQAYLEYEQKFEDRKEELNEKVELLTTYQQKLNAQYQEVESKMLERITQLDEIIEKQVKVVEDGTKQEENSKANEETL